MHLQRDTSYTMNVLYNGTTINATDNISGIEYRDRQLHELVYITITLFIGTLSALIASFLGLRRRQRFPSAST